MTVANLPGQIDGADGTICAITRDNRMLQIGVKSTLDQVLAAVGVFDDKQLPFAVSKALNDTANQARDAVRAKMPSNFTIRRDWVVKGIQVVPATKQSLSAIVWSRDDYMALQETGGDKTPFGKYLAIPLPAVKPTAGSIVRKEDYPRNIPATLTAPGKGGQLTAVVTMRNGKKFIARASANPTKGKRLELLYYLMPTAHLKPRLNLETITDQVVADKFADNFEKAIALAMSTARP
jgi:hypothetical protein